MKPNGIPKILFVINPGSGKDEVDYKAEISNYFAQKNHAIDFFMLPEKIDKVQLAITINAAAADKIIAVGGDGTVKLVAECLLDSESILGILPAGSANGMAKELGIPAEIEDALKIIEEGATIKIHLVKINDEICIHLADLGFNAYLVKVFDSLPQRGMWGYFKASVQAIISHRRMEVALEIGGKTVNSKAAMVAIANATKYGTGLKINPDGKLDDDLFEVVLVKDYSYFEILKKWLTRLPYNPEKVEVFQTRSLKIASKYKAHFQVDGEYLGTVNKVKATLLPAAIKMLTGPDFGESE